MEVLDQPGCITHVHNVVTIRELRHAKVEVLDCIDSWSLHPYLFRNFKYVQPVALEF